MLVRRESLVFNSQASSATNIAAPAITDTNPQPSPALVPPTTLAADPVPLITPPPDAPLPDATDSPQQPGAATSTPAHSTINLGTVVGACLGSFAVLILVIVLVIWHSRRSRKSIQLQERQTKRDNWNKLADNSRDSRRSSFESKPSLPQSSLEYTAEYPPSHSNPLFSQTQNTSQYIIPSHPYSSSHSVRPDSEEGSKRSGNNNPFADPGTNSKESENDAASLYSTASNPFESVYVQPGSKSNPIQTPENYSGNPFFTPHPDSSVQGEKWGSVGKERNVQESYASKGNGDSDKLGSLIAALDLDGRNSNEEEKADCSIHGHLGKFDA